MADFSDYIVYADESGDHGLDRIDQDFPVFCLAFVAVKKTEYIEKLVPAIQRIKFDFWGHDWVVFHEHEIRKQKETFAIFKNDRILRADFYQRINQLIEVVPFWVISAVIRKNVLREHYSKPFNPYDLALRFCLERLFRLMRDEGQLGKKITLMFEKRGRLEDRQLQEEFYKIVRNNKLGSSDIPDKNKITGFRRMEFEILFAGKERNFIGMQVADLIARPIALSVLRPEQENRAYSIIKKKYPFGRGNKIFP